MECDPGERKKIRIDPGMAFGTGLDETTRLCLEAIERTVREGHKVLDIGCGSGILSIGALLLGAEFALGIDVDETAVKTAKENAKLNNVSNQSEFICEDPVDIITEKYDLVCANISADAIIKLMPELVKALNYAGTLILSGIISNRTQDVESAMLHFGLSIIECTEENDWACIISKF